MEAITSQGQNSREGHEPSYKGGLTELPLPSLHMEIQEENYNLDEGPHWTELASLSLPACLQNCEKYISVVNKYSFCGNLV